MNWYLNCNLHINFAWDVGWLQLLRNNHVFLQNHILFTSILSRASTFQKEILSIVHIRFVDVYISLIDCTINLMSYWRLLRVSFIHKYWSLQHICRRINVIRVIYIIFYTCNIYIYILMVVVSMHKLFSLLYSLSLSLYFPFVLNC